MDQKISYCLGRKHYNQTITEIVYEKIKPKTNKLVKTFKGRRNVCGRSESHIFTE